MKGYDLKDKGLFYDPPVRLSKHWTVNPFDQHFDLLLKNGKWLCLKIPHSIRHTILRPAFWLGFTLGFPIEHLLWERVWPFSWITKHWLGL